MKKDLNMMTAPTAQHALCVGDAESTTTSAAGALGVPTAVTLLPPEMGHAGQTSAPALDETLIAPCAQALPGIGTPR